MSSVFVTGVAMGQKETSEFVPFCHNRMRVRIFFCFSHFFIIVFRRGAFGGDHLRAHTHTDKRRWQTHTDHHQLRQKRAQRCWNGRISEIVFLFFFPFFLFFCSEYVYCLQLIFSGAHIEYDSADIIDDTKNDTLFRTLLLWWRRRQQQQRWRWWEYKLYSLSKCIEMRRCDSKTIDKSFAHLLASIVAVMNHFGFSLFMYFGRKEM